MLYILVSMCKLIEIEQKSNTMLKIHLCHAPSIVLCHEYILNTIFDNNK